MNKRMRVCVDLDQTVGNYIGAFRGSVAGQLGVPVENLDERPDYHFTEWGIADRFQELHSYAVGEDRIFRSMEPFPGVTEALNELDEAGALLTIVTSRLCVPWRHEVAIGDTVGWLDSIPVPYHELHAIRGKDLSKVETVAFDVLIDDKPAEVLAAREAGKVGIVFGDTAYNDHLPGPRALRWKEVPELVLGLV